MLAQEIEADDAVRVNMGVDRNLSVGGLNEHHFRRLYIQVRMDWVIDSALHMLSGDPYRLDIAAQT